MTPRAWAAAVGCSVDLRRVDPRVAEQRADLFEIVVLLQDLHRDAVPQVVRLQLGVPDHPAIHLAERQMFCPVIGAFVLPTPRQAQARCARLASNGQGGVNGPCNLRDRGLGHLP
jgi:hypothetical protein